MRFTDLFIKRPVLAIVVNLVILIAGLQSIRALSVRQYPRSDIAVIRVSTIYVGANADLVRGFITTPLERVIASADGIDYMTAAYRINHDGWTADQAFKEMKQFKFGADFLHAEFKQWVYGYPAALRTAAAAVATEAAPLAKVGGQQ